MLLVLLNWTYHIYGIETSGKRQPCCQAIEDTGTEDQLVGIFEQLTKPFGTSQWFQGHCENARILDFVVDTVRVLARLF